MGKLERGETLNTSRTEIVQTSEGTFRLVYGYHISMQPKEDLGTNYGAVVLESGPDSADYTPDTKAKHLQYKDIFAELQRTKKPVFLTDFGSLADLAGAFVGGAKLGIGMGLASSAKRAMERPLSRRKFITQMAKRGVGWYLQSDAILTALSLGAGLVSHDLSRPFTSATETLHPDSQGVILTLRNLVSAHKMANLYRNNPELFAGGSSELAAVWGQAHTGLRDALQMSASERLRHIEKIARYHPLMFSTPEEMARLTRIEYAPDRDAWHITESIDPDILEVAQKAKDELPSKKSS